MPDRIVYIYHHHVLIPQGGVKGASHVEHESNENENENETETENENENENETENETENERVIGRP